MSILIEINYIIANNNECQSVYRINTLDQLHLSPTVALSIVCKRMSHIYFCFQYSKNRSLLPFTREIFIPHQPASQFYTTHKLDFGRNKLFQFLRNKFNLLYDNPYVWQPRPEVVLLLAHFISKMETRQKNPERFLFDCTCYGSSTLSVSFFSFSNFVSFLSSSQLAWDAISLSKICTRFTFQKHTFCFVLYTKSV